MDYKASLIDYNLIKITVEKYAEETGTPTASAFLAVVLNRWLGLDDTETISAIIDGSDDFGIDAIYIDESTENERPTVYLFQSKFYLSDSKFNRAFEGNALDKMAHAINVLLRNATPTEDITKNQRLQDKIKDVKSILNKMPTFEIVFCSNSYPPSEQARNNFALFISNLNTIPDTMHVTYLHLSEISKVLAPEKREIIDADIRISGPILNWDNGQAKTVIGRLSGSELAKLRDVHQDKLFDKNVRGYLSRKNNVNKDIYDSATSNTSSNFFYLNNGLTIVCKKLLYSIENESPTLRLSDMQIVNGGQTTNAIYDAYKAGTLKEHVYVLAKIIETENKDLVEQITEATNKQTIVTARDLRSNDPIQKKIEEFFKHHGYYYEARKDKYIGEKRSKRVDAAKAAQAYYAFNNQEPADAKNKKRFLFGTFYYEIFNDSLDMERFLVAFRLYQQVNKICMGIRDKFGFANYAELHILAMLKAYDINCLSDLEDVSKINEHVMEILNAIDKVVKEEIARKGDEYSHRAFFIDPSLLGRIKEQLGK